MNDDAFDARVAAAGGLPPLPDRPSAEADALASVAERLATSMMNVLAARGASANVTVNIAAPDADSFRRSEAYLAGQIARAVARGQRVL